MSRYLLAQYTPDRLRQEPRNIGIVVWTSFGVTARFLAERHDAPQGVDRRRVPYFINGADVYTQWVMFWRQQLAQEVLSPLSGGPSVPRSSPEYLQVLQGYGRGEYTLVDGGVFLDGVSPEDLDLAADQLFNSLVRDGSEQDPDPPVTQHRLNQEVKRLLERSGLARHANLEPNYPVRCRIKPARGGGEVEEEIKFTYAFGNGIPYFLYQNVALPRQATELNRSVRSTLWMFEQVFSNDILQPEHCRALVSYPEQLAATTETKRAIRSLESLVPVLNVQEQKRELLHEFVELARKPEIRHTEVGSLFSI